MNKFPSILWYGAVLLLAFSTLQSCSTKVELKEAAIKQKQPAKLLEFIGATQLKAGLEFGATKIGGLSGLDYNIDENVFYAISDDRGGVNYPRFYSLKIDIQDGKLSDGDVEFLSATEILNPNNGHYQEGIVDPESIRYHSGNRQFFWSSEGSRGALIAPSVRSMSSDGKFANEFSLPEYYSPKKEQGIRDNKSLESLTFSSNKQSFYTATETTLYQDGPEENTRQGGMARVIRVDLNSGSNKGEYIYPTAAIAEKPFFPGLFATNGLVELLTVAPETFIAVERSFTLGKGNTIRLYLTTTKTATNVQGKFSITDQLADLNLMPKKLILNLDELQTPLDNIEAISFGPKLESGEGTLVLVSDDNFNPSAQRTIFIAFKFKPGIFQQVAW